MLDCMISLLRARQQFSATTGCTLKLSGKMSRLCNWTSLYCVRICFCHRNPCTRSSLYCVRKCFRHRNPCTSGLDRIASPKPNTTASSRRASTFATVRSAFKSALCCPPRLVQIWYAHFGVDSCVHPDIRFNIAILSLRTAL